MRPIRLLLLPLLAAATLAAASEPLPSGAPSASTTATAVTAPAAPLPLLWKVSDADNSVYLLGSFHLLKKSDYPVSSDIEAALAGSTNVVFEVTPDQLHDPANAPKFMAAAGYGDARTLSTVLPPALHAKLDAILVAQGGSVAHLDSYEPWFVNLSMVLGMAQSLGFSPEQGLDQYLMKRASSAGKSIGGLETIDAQLQALDASPMPEQIIGLSDFVDRPQEMPGQLADMHAAWRSGDAERLDALTGAEMREKTPVTYQAMLVDRNDAWMPQLQAMLDGSSQDTLVVVGALHLLGDDGVVEKLRTRGYEVERICSACTAN